MTNKLKVRIQGDLDKIISRSRECVWAEITFDDKRITLQTVGDNVICNFTQDGKFIKSLSLEQLYLLFL